MSAVNPIIVKYYGLYQTGQTISATYMIFIDGNVRKSNDSALGGLSTYNRITHAKIYKPVARVYIAILSMHQTFIDLLNICTFII